MEPKKETKHIKPDRKNDRFEGRCTTEQKDQIYRIAKSRGLNFSQMILKDYLAVEPETETATPTEELVLNLLIEFRQFNEFLENNAIPLETRIQAIDTWTKFGFQQYEIFAKLLK